MPKIHKDRDPTYAEDVVSRETDPLAVFKGAYAAEEAAASTAVSEPVDTPRRRGRPKGSRNKPKGTVAQAQAAEGGAVSRA
jgi:hypothetical protein